ncbi:MAG: dihydrodipicolinate synthase family protein [Sphingobacteriales bacterium]|nr:dihydrodipicolinate synthase family protein [Sphingobacteriales bacterium]OJY91339.1 MAG: dihydrodipicolinate synthase family protein [Sphingobacteriales bacterium 44-15]
MENGFKGIWPAMFTPVNEKGEPAYDELEKLVELLISQDQSGLYILGSTGQGILFTIEQRKKVTEVVMQTVAKRIPVMVQVGALTTADSIQLATHAEKMGVDGISSVGPIYYAASSDMAIAHYRQIAEATVLPFFPYQLGDHSIPGDTITFVKRLMDIPNVTGMKLTTNQLLDISLIHNYAGERLKLFSGSDELFCHASLCGTVGAIGSFYNLWGPQCKYVMEEFLQGNYKLTKKFMLEFQNIIQTIMPNIWTFLRSAMRLKYNIDIGQTKPPLANTHRPWENEDVLKMMDKLERITDTVIQK